MISAGPTSSINVATVSNLTRFLSAVLKYILLRSPMVMSRSAFSRTLYLSPSPGESLYLATSIPPAKILAASATALVDKPNSDINSRLRLRLT